MSRDNYAGSNHFLMDYMLCISLRHMPLNYSVRTQYMRANDLSWRPCIWPLSCPKLLLLTFNVADNVFDAVKTCTYWNAYRWPYLCSLALVVSQVHNIRECIFMCRKYTLSMPCYNSIKCCYCKVQAKKFGFINNIILYYCTQLLINYGSILTYKWCISTNRIQLFT